MHRHLAVLLLWSSHALADAATGLPVFIEDRPKVDPRDRGTERYLTFGLLTSPTGGTFGVRAQLDLASFAGFSIGAAGTLFGRGVRDLADMPMFRASAVGYLAYTTTPLVRNLRLRLALGYGAAYTLEQDATTMMATSTQLRIVEGSILVSGRANHDWSVIGGPIVQRSDAGSTAMLFFGVQRRY